MTSFVSNISVDVTKQHQVSKAFDLLQALNVSFFQEVAADVAQKMEPEEASDVFINVIFHIQSLKKTAFCMKIELNLLLVACLCRG